MNKHIPSFDSFVNEARITWGEELAYNLNHDTPKVFIRAYEGQGVDIFFTKDGRSAIVTQRTSNLVSHGKDAAKSMNTSDVKFVYCGLEKEFYSPEDYKKLLNAVYKGSRNPKVKALSINESELNEGAFFRLPKDVIGNDLYIASKNLTNFYERSAAGNDVDAGVIDTVIRKLTAVKKAIKKFNNAEDIAGTVYEGAVNEAAVKQFDKDVQTLIKNIKSGYGWIEPEYVVDSWENSSDTIDFGLVKGEVLKRLFNAGVLYHSSANGKDRGAKVTLSEVGALALIKESEVNEGAMSDIDLLAQDSKDFKDFVKNFKKDYKNMDAGNAKELEAWLKSVYDEAKSNR